LIIISDARYWIIPYERNSDFAGRDAEFDELHELLRSAKRFHYRVALHGLGGVGKTQFALEFAFRNCDDYDDVFWISAADRPTMLSGFRKIAKITGCLGQSDSSEEAALGVLRWLSARTRWLFIIDNLDDITVAKSLLPSGNINNHVLITTRNSNCIGIPALGYAVDVLSVEQAAEILLRRITIEETVRSKEEIKEATKIVKELGCLPLAIEQAAGYIREACKSILQFLPIYRKGKSHLLARSPAGNSIYPHSVATTWLVSVTRLEKYHPDAVSLLYLFAFMHPDGIPVEYLRLGASGLGPRLQEILLSELRLQESLAALDSISLIRRSHDGTVISIHRLVQATIQNHLDARTREFWQDNAVDLAASVLHASSGVDAVYWGQLEHCAEKATEKNWKKVNSILMWVRCTESIWSLDASISETLHNNYVRFGDASSLEAVLASCVLSADIHLTEMWKKLFHAMDKIDVTQRGTETYVAAWTRFCAIHRECKKIKDLPPFYETLLAEYKALSDKRERPELEELRVVCERVDTNRSDLWEWAEEQWLKVIVGP